MVVSLMDKFALACRCYTEFAKNGFDQSSNLDSCSGGITHFSWRRVVLHTLAAAGTSSAAALELRHVFGAKSSEEVLERKDGAVVPSTLANLEEPGCL